MKISVIVPIFNTEQYIHRCIDSIIAQTYRDLEIILIDDGSPDHCGMICDEYMESIIYNYCECKKIKNNSLYNDLARYMLKRFRNSYNSYTRLPIKDKLFYLFPNLYSALRDIKHKYSYFR